MYGGLSTAPSPRSRMRRHGPAYLDRSLGAVPAQQDADVVDDITGEFGDVGEGGFDDFAAIAFAQTDEVGGAGSAVGDGDDIHGN